MNNTFEFTRFKKVISLDYHNFVRHFRLTIIGLILLQIIIWIGFSLYGADCSPLVRYNFMKIVVCLAIIIAPMQLYGKANMQREGVQFAMLPASALEKFISMFLYCAIATPVVFLIGDIALDSLLTVLPFGSFAQFIFDLKQTTFNQMSASMNLVSLHELNGLTVISFIVSILCTVALFMFGNMIFKKHKTMKTLSVILVAGFILIIIFSIITTNNPDAFFMNQIQDEADSKTVLYAFMRKTMVWNTIIQAILCIGLLFGTFYKIKTQKY